MLLDVPVEDVLKIKVLLKKIYWMANLKKRARKRARQIKSARLKHNQPQKPKNSWMLFLETQDRGDASIKVSRQKYIPFKMIYAYLRTLSVCYNI